VVLKGKVVWKRKVRGLDCLLVVRSGASNREEAIAPLYARRVVAVELLVHSVPCMTDISPLLPVLMPELLRRMGNLPVVEQAVRVCMCVACSARHQPPAAGARARAAARHGQPACGGAGGAYVHVYCMR